MPLRSRMRGASRREACVRRRGRRRSGSNRRSNGLWSEQVRTGAPSGAGGMVGYDERRTTGSVPWVRTSGRPSFFCAGEREGRGTNRRPCGWRGGAEERGWSVTACDGERQGAAVCVRSRSLDGWRPAVCPMRRRVTERGRERQRAAGILPGPEGPEGLEGPGVVLSCNLPGQAMQRIPPVYYLCR